jgi:hypothetical protein
VSGATLIHEPQPTVVHVTAHDSGLDWGDTAIGAGGAITLIVVAAGGAYATGARRARRLREGSASAAS